MDCKYCGNREFAHIFVLGVLFTPPLLYHRCSGLEQDVYQTEESPDVYAVGNLWQVFEDHSIKYRIIVGEEELSKHSVIVRFVRGGQRAKAVTSYVYNPLHPSIA